jgi:uncharacterized membrane protein YkoI
MFFISINEPIKKSLQLAWLFMGLSLSMVASSNGDFHEARRLIEAGSILPLERIFAEVYSQYRGRILEVELEHDIRGYVYEIEILDDHGIVRELMFDAVSAKCLRAKRDN